MSNNNQYSPPGFSYPQNDNKYNYSMGYEVGAPPVSTSPTFYQLEGSDSSDHSYSEYNTVNYTLRPSRNSFPNNQVQGQMPLGQRFRETHSTSDSAVHDHYSQPPIPYNMFNECNNSQLGGESFRSYSSSEEFLPDYLEQPVEITQYQYYPQPKMSNHQPPYRQPQFIQQPQPQYQYQMPNQQYPYMQQHSPQQMPPPPGMHLPPQVIHKRNPGLPPAAPVNQYYEMRNVVNGMNRMVLHSPPPPPPLPLPSSSSSPIISSNNNNNNNNGYISSSSPTQWCDVNKYNQSPPNMSLQQHLPISPPISPMMLPQQYSGSSTTSVNSISNNNNSSSNMVNSSNNCNISPSNNNNNMISSASASSSASSSASNLNVSSIISDEINDDDNNNNNVASNSNNVLKWLPKNQQNCRILQTKIEEDPVNNLVKVLSALEDHYEEIIIDPFGNYLFQKVFDFITDSDEITSILNKIKPYFISSATNLHGSRSMQRLVKSCTTSEQFEIIIECLRPHIESLCQDPHGNHVLQLCLEIFPTKMTEFIYNIIENNIGTISITKFGCYVVQKAYEVAENDRKVKLAKSLISHTKDIIGNQYGNYALQYVLENGKLEYSYDVVKTIKGSIIKLCMQKYSSNVLEKLIQTNDYKIQIEIVNELVRYPRHLTTVIQHRFGIYVVRRLLTTLLPEILPVFKKAFQPIYESLKDNSKFKKNIQVLSTIPEFSEIK